MSDLAVQRTAAAPVARLARPPRAPARNTTRGSAAPIAPMLEEGAHSARAAGLTYVTDDRPGLRRLASGQGFRYLDASGKAVRDREVLQRIRSLAIPPAWTDVWICPSANGHLQATGRDARGRKQYRYHPKWRSARDENKFGRLIAFAHALPTIRRKVAADLRLPGLPREKVLAAIVRLLESTFIRIGNEQYARENGSFGLTTMRSRHVRIKGERIAFDFRGKSGRQHHVELEDARLARIIRRCRDLPGYELFRYVDGGEPRSIGSSDVNEYLKTISGEDYTAKDFRTWAGTVLAVLALKGAECPRSQTEARKTLNAAIGEVAKRLGNTVAVCRKCYIHPRVMDLFLEGAAQGSPSAYFSDPALAVDRRRGVEQAVIRLLAGRRSRPSAASTRRSPAKASAAIAREAGSIVLERRGVGRKAVPRGRNGTAPRPPATH